MSFTLYGLFVIRERLYMWKKDKVLAYLVLRLALGINFLMHGLVRIPNMAEFVDSVANSFKNTWMPNALAVAFAYVIPYAEALIGLLVLAGAWTRWALFAGGVLLCLLIFGKTLQQDWTTVGTQMVYILCLFFALFFSEFNSYSVDKINRK